MRDDPVPSAFDLPGDSAELIPGYRTIRQLGHGATSVVYLATQKTLGRQTVLKVLAATDVLDQRRFLREAKILSRISHPGIVQLLDYGCADGRPYIAVPFVEAETLAAVLARRRRLPEKEARSLARELAGALAALHDAGIIHRDLKPANVLILAGGRPMLIDFGLGRATGDPSLTDTNEYLGTPAYSSPEQFLCKPDIGPQSDLFSLGILLAEALTGRNAFAGATFAETCERVLNLRLGEPPALEPPVSERLWALVLELLEKSPQDRPPNGRALEAALDALRHEGQPPATVRPPALDTTAKTPSQPAPKPAEPQGPRVSTPGRVAIGAVAAGCILLTLALARGSLRSPAADATSEGPTSAVGRHANEVPSFPESLDAAARSASITRKTMDYLLAKASTMPKDEVSSWLDRTLRADRNLAAALARKELSAELAIGRGNFVAELSRCRAYCEAIGVPVPEASATGVAAPAQTEIEEQDAVDLLNPSPFVEPGSFPLDAQVRQHGFGDVLKEFRPPQFFVGRVLALQLVFAAPNRRCFVDARVRGGSFQQQFYCFPKAVGSAVEARLRLSPYFSVCPAIVVDLSFGHLPMEEQPGRGELTRARVAVVKE